MESKSFLISYWNIQGLRSFAFGFKSKTLDFKRHLGNAHIFILQETSCNGDILTGCPKGYRELVIPSIKLKGISQDKDSGGILNWYKANHVHSIELIKKMNIQFG